MKKWLTRSARSKTMMFNLLVAIFASLEGVFHMLQPFMDGNVFAYITVLLTVGNAILRVITTQPLKDK